MPTDLDSALSVASSGRHDGVFRAAIDRTWWIDRGPNGGFLASVILAGMQEGLGTPERRPVSLTVHYLDRPAEGIVDVATAVERSGRSMTTASARLVQDGRLLALALGTFSLPRTSGSFTDLEMPEVPAPEELPEIPVPPELLPPFAQNFEYRFALGSLPYSSSERAVVGGWMRPRVPRVVDPLVIPTFADGWPPAVFARLAAPIGVPTIDLTVHFRTPLPLDGAAPGDWTLMLFESGHAGDGLLEESGTMWSRDGRLIAQSRQVALYRDSVSYWPG